MLDDRVTGDIRNRGQDGGGGRVVWQQLGQRRRAHDQPVGAPHAFTAEKMIDFVYQPEIQAKITAYVNYVPPVKGTKQVLLKTDPEIANNPLIFPDLTNAHNFKTFSPKDEAEIDAAFQKVVGS